MTKKRRGRTGYYPADIFFWKTTSILERPYAHAGNPEIEALDQ